MRKLLIAAVALTALVSSCTNGTRNVELKTQNDSLSHAAGMILASQIERAFGNLELNPAILAAAVEYVASAKDVNELQSEFMTADAFLKNYMTVVVPKQKKVVEEKFLAEIAKKSNINVTESGLYYEIIEPGDMENTPEATSTVVAHYVGTLHDGSEFDSSVKRGEPITIALNRVIPGWTEGMQLIGKGGKINLYVPSDLAYKNSGQLAYEALKFEIELIDIK